jgi:D-alanyl-D-alanine dipeptidase
LFILLLTGSPLHSQDLPRGFAYLQDKVPDIQLELRYLGTENFMGRPVDGYHEPVAITTKRTVRALKRIQRKLKKQGLGLKIYDAYRPQTGVNHFIRWAKKHDDTIKKKEYYPDVPKSELFVQGYIAERSGHSRGSTVDLTLVRLDDGSELDMGSPWDFFGERSWVDHQDLTQKQKANRQLLQKVMIENGFRNYAKEWWHFTLDKEPFPDEYFDFPVR